LAKLSAAAILEIAGCYLMNTSRTMPLAVVILIAFAYVLTTVRLDDAARVYAAYGGIYVTAAFLFAAHRLDLTRYDIVGVVLTLLGSGIIIYGYQRSL